MSEPANIKTYQESYDALVKKVYGPVFFNKLASAYGIPPGSEEEAGQLLALAAKLRQVELSETVKTAGARTNVLSEAHRDLDKLMGVPASNLSPVDDAAVKQAAAELAQDQEMRDAALTYQDYLVQLAHAQQAK